MLAIALAGAIAAGPAPAPVLGDPPAACRLARLVARATPGEVRAQRLIDLPKAREEIAVDRRVNGCPVPVIVRYDVEKRR
jgi:hypothetical protein